MLSRRGFLGWLWSFTEGLAMHGSCMSYGVCIMSGYMHEPFKMVDNRNAEGTSMVCTFMEQRGRPPSKNSLPFSFLLGYLPSKKSKALSFSFGPKSSFSRVSFLPFKYQTPHPFSNHAWPFFLFPCPEVFSKNQKKPLTFRVFLQGIK